MTDSMNLCLPRPYPDELMYSVFARHFAYLQPTVISSAHRSIDDHKWFSMRYVRGAAGLAEKTRLTWGLSGLQILDRHTLLPFNGAFLKPEVHLQCTECFMTNNPHGGPTALGMSNSSVSEPKFLRFCASCLHEDIQGYGETYWRRQHQLSGTLVCVRHDELLRDSTAPFSQRADATTLDATAHCSAAFGPGITLSTNEVLLARLIAKRSAALLNGGVGIWLTSNTSSRYERAAIENGYGFGVTKLNTNKFGRDLLGFFGATFLEKLGCRLSERSSALRHILHGAGTNHPVIHILVQLFLEGGLESSRSGLKPQVVNGTTRQEWKCPNIYAGHDEGFRIPDILLRRTKDGAKYYHARCSCGFMFAFAGSREDDLYMPLVLKTSGYGKAMENEARRLHKKKPSVKYVAETMGVSHRVADRLVKREKSRNELDATRIPHLRAEWKETKSRAAYQLLLRWDGDWIRRDKRTTKNTHRTNHFGGVRQSIRRGSLTNGA
ncbi:MULTISPECIES: TnsD family Tn7-like transposition protein [unclassified Bradyrhizobium]|uniref:TnsD family Tn7-like transposition protein n=1 Tax=unclassified Bradyrhizobium TaxID=2631580 RepID=UPI002FF10E1F